MFPFYTPLKTPENQRFAAVFRGYKMGTLARNGLKINFHCLQIDAPQILKKYILLVSLPASSSSFSNEQFLGNFCFSVF